MDLFHYEIWHPKYEKQCGVSRRHCPLRVKGQHDDLSTAPCGTMKVEFLMDRHIRR